MATNYTSLLGFALPTTGELAGTWGQVVNDSITQLVEDSVAGTASVSVTSGNVTLTNTGSGAANQARCAIIIATGTPGTARQIIAPSQSKAYIVINNSDSNVTFKGAATTGHTLKPGEANLLAWNGSDYMDIEQGDVAGPASSTDNAIARYDGTTGKLIQNSAVTVADDGSMIIDANSTVAGLRITQTGSGNALLVEDSANPDSSPLVVNNSGFLVVGHTGTIAPSGLSASLSSVFGSTSAAGTTAGRYSDDVNPPEIRTFKSRSATIGSNTIVQSGDTVGRLSFYGDDGTAFILGAQINAVVDGTPGTNDMPGRLVFSTTADGASSPTERMRITSTGSISVGPSAPAAGRNFVINAFLTGSTTSRALTAIGTVQSDVTSTASYFATSVSVQDAAFALTNLSHFEALQGTISGGSRLGVTNQYGFNVGSSLTGATNNYGFYSNIASGTGRWNFYAADTAANYFAGQVQLGAGALATPSLSVTGDTNTGIYFPAADTLGFVVGGNEELRITAAGFTQPVAYADTVVALGNSGTASTINLTTGNVFTATLTGNCTFTLSSPIATGASSFTLILTNDGTAGRTVAWSGGSFNFPGGAASLSRTTTANATDIWAFFTPNGGTTWYGNIVMKDVKA